MSNSADGRPTALVTGAGYGIGRAIAVGLSRNGYDLILTGRSSDLLKKVSDEVARGGGRADDMPLDLTVPADRENLVDRARSLKGGLSLFVHCAATTTDPDIESELGQTPHDRITEVMETTATAGMHILKGLKSPLAQAAPSHAIFLASDWAFRGSHGPPIFSAAKAALVQFARTSRREFQGAGIALSVIVPGDVASYDADWAEPTWSIDDPVQQVRASLGEQRIPLIDIVESVLFIINRHMSRIEELHIAPSDPAYDY